MSWTKEVFCGQVLAAEASLYRVARAILRSDADCADAIQEGILKAYQNLDSLKDARHFRTWLTRIVINECRQILRRRKQAAAYEDKLPYAAEAPAPGDSWALFELQKMDEKYRLPIVLNVIEGYTSAEIAAMMNLPHATVRTRLARGKKILRQNLEGGAQHEQTI